MVSEVYIGMGSNLGSRLQHLMAAGYMLEEGIGQVICRSSVYETEPWGYREQPAFLNQCLLLHTVQKPVTVLQHIQKVEERIGRKRQNRWGERLIDIDILFFDRCVIARKLLKIPHPYLHLRRFVLEPLAEIAPKLQHPVLHKTTTTLLAKCPDHSWARLAVREPQYAVPLYHH